MAGAGFKTFNTGDVLTASDVNTYLMQQTVMVFDDASARSTALPTPSEGMFSYLKDTNLTYRYDGSAWLSDAGTTSPLTTKGDVWGYSTADARIPVGADGTVLTADSAEALGVKWAAAAGGGKVLQVVSAYYNTQTANSTSTYADTGLTATITPSAATSKIAVFVAQNGCNKSNGNTLNQVQIKLLRDAVEIAMAYVGYTETLLQTNSSVSLLKLDDPNTTSAVTYKTQFRNPNNTASVTVQNAGSASVIILMEIGA